MNRFDLPTCSECDRLWQAYQRATNEHLHLVNALNQPGSREKETAELLINQINAAEYARKAARQALEDHRFDSGHH